MKRRITYAACTYLIAMVVLTFIPGAFDALRTEYETRVDVYEKPWAVRWMVTDEGLSFTGVSRKRANCDVVPGSAILISAGWQDSTGTHVRAFPAVRPTGDHVIGEPILESGDEFVIGPWLIKGKPELLHMIDHASVKLTCRFPSGTTRVATIGPIRKADAQ